MRFLLAYTFFIFSAALGAVANTQPNTGVDLSSFCANGREHCSEAVSATTTAPSKTVPFGKKARLSNALRHAHGKAHRASGRVISLIHDKFTCGLTLNEITDFQRRQTGPSGVPQLERTGVM